VAAAEWDAIPKGDHRQGLLGVNCGRNWTVVHDTQVCFVDDYSATPEVARAINADVIIASIADTAGMETFSYATPQGYGARLLRRGRAGVRRG
jgi:hypothetical protein